MQKDRLRTKWSVRTSPQEQVQRVLAALLSIGAENIKGISVFVRYEDEAGDTQTSIFTGGTDVDEVYNWAVKELNK